MGQSLELRQALNLEQKQSLGLLLQLRQELKSPPPFEAAKGIEGLQVANDILLSRETAGILIGGVAETVWNKARKSSELDEHKDVDVMVLGDGTGFEEDFEGGIDWWLPHTERINIPGAVLSAEMDWTWWRNGNDVALSFGVKTVSNLSPGLYIPDQSWIVDMRFLEASVAIDGNVEYEVEEAFRKKVRSKMKDALMPEITRKFGSNVFKEGYVNGDFRVRAPILDGFDRRTMAAIRKLSA